MIHTKILIADDHSMVRDGIKSVLRERKDWAVIGEAKNGIEALEMYYDLRPDVVVLDISMPGKDGMDVAAEILDASPAADIIMLSMYDEEEYIGRSVKLGVKGYVIKSDSSEELVNAIESILQGNTYFSARVQHSIFHQYTEWKRNEPDDAVHLTKRELEIMEWLSKRLTSQQIASHLSISIRTVETHRSNLLKKLGVHTSVELVKKAEELGLIAGGAGRFTK